MDTSQFNLNTILLMVSIVGYTLTYLYQLKRIRDLEKSRADIQAISDQIKSYSDMMKNYADMIKIDEFKKYLELEKSNLRAQLEKDFEERIAKERELSEEQIKKIIREILSPEEIRVMVRELTLEMQEKKEIELNTEVEKPNSLLRKLPNHDK